MANYTGTAADDDFISTSNADTFFFGENEGLDVIVGFDVFSDVIAYTDESVDDLQDIKITRYDSSDGTINTVIESNDQITVLADVDPFALTEANFTFTTGGGGSINDARDPDDIYDLPADFDQTAADARIAALTDDGTPEPSPDTTALVGGGYVKIVQFVDDTTDTELIAELYDANGEQVRRFYVYEDSDLNKDPVVTALDNGGFAVAWVSQDDDDFVDARVMVKAYDSAGTQQGSTWVLDGDDEIRADEPAIARLSNGNFVVVYENESAISVRGTIFTPEGRIAESTRTLFDVSGTGETPAVEANDDGGFTVTYGSITRTFDGSGEETAAAPDDAIVGTDGAERLNGTRDDDMILGEAGNDRLVGRGGDDHLEGGEGDDVLAGGNGDDTLVSEAGDRDRMRGGEGADRFVVSDQTSIALVLDFEDGVDTIEVESGAQSFGDLRVIERDNGDLVLRDGDTRIVIKSAGDADLLDPSDFSFTPNGDDAFA